MVTFSTSTSFVPCLQTCEEKLHSGHYHDWNLEDILPADMKHHTYSSPRKVSLNSETCSIVEKILVCSSNLQTYNFI